MLPFRRFSVLQALAQAATLSGAQLQAKMQEADALFQSHFDAKRQDELRKLYVAMKPDAKERIDTIVAHMVRLTTAERIVFSEELRKAKLKKLGAKDALGLGWTPLARKGTEQKTEGSGLAQVGLSGFAAETTLKLLKGEFTAKLTAAAPREAANVAEEKPKEEEKMAFDVFLVKFKAESKVALIKLVKDLLKLGLKESKEKVEEALKAPALLFKTLPKDKVKEIQTKLEAAGGTLEIK